MSQGLSKKTVAILSLIADGNSYEQIIEGHPDINYMDIFNAAQEALQLNASQTTYHERMEKIKTQHPRAYQPWTDEEDAKLREMHEGDIPVREIAAEFQRQPGAIRSRLTKLGLLPPKQKVDEE